MYNMYNNPRYNTSPRRMKVTIYTLDIEKYHEDKEYLLFTKSHLILINSTLIQQRHHIIIKTRSISNHYTFPSKYQNNNSIM